MNKRLQKEFENSCEYLLPDYMGDVKKLLTSNAKAFCNGKFVGEDCVEISGSVEYDLLYVDAEGKLTPVSVASDFSESFEIDSEKYIDCAEESKILGVRVRVTGPRKILLKADMQTSLTVREEDCVGINLDSLSQNTNVEKCSAEVNFANSVFLKSGEREYAEIVERLEGDDFKDAEIISSSASTVVNSVSVSDGEVSIKGENIVSAIVSIGDSAPRLVKKAFPFEEVIVSEDIKSNMMAVADGCVGSVSVGIGSDGEGSALVANIISEYSVELMENTSATVITDAYTVDCDCKNSYKNSELSELVWAGTEKFSIDLRCEKTRENLKDLSQIISMCAQLRSVNVTETENECQFSGEIMLNGVGYETNVDGSQTYIPIKIQEEFREKVNVGCQISDKNKLECFLSVNDCEVECDAQILFVKCHVTAKIYVYNPKTVNVLTACEVIDSAVEGRAISKITVYYPKEGDRLFDVAKKYKTTSKKIAEDNLLTESALSSFDTANSLMGVKKLIIR